MLYLIPTPIGNREDITLRALRLLNELSVLLCEDTRTLRSLCAMYDIPTQHKTLHSLTSFTNPTMIQHFISQMKAGDCGLVSEAGTPGLSDPGKEMIKICFQQNIPFEILPGANALIPAVVGSGFDTKQFVFYGFMPAKKGRNTLLRQIMSHEIPSFVYESVHRIPKFVSELQMLQFDGLISIGREISKLHHQHWTGTLTQLTHALSDGSIVCKGERVIGLHPCSTNCTS